MTLFVDKKEKYDFGGFTSDLKKTEYNLAAQGLSFEKILNSTPKTTEIPSGMFTSGKYVVFFNIAWNLKKVQIGFINYQTDLDKYFDIFADSMSPKLVAGFHKLREQVKVKDQSELNKIELSDNELDFEIAYRNYKEQYNRQS